MQLQQYRFSCRIDVGGQREKRSMQIVVGELTRARHGIGQVVLDESGGVRSWMKERSQVVRQIEHPDRRPEQQDPRPFDRSDRGTAIESSGSRVDGPIHACDRPDRSPLRCAKYISNNGCHTKAFAEHPAQG